MVRVKLRERLNSWKVRLGLSRNRNKNPEVSKLIPTPYDTGIADIPRKVRGGVNLENHVLDADSEATTGTELNIDNTVLSKGSLVQEAYRRFDGINGSLSGNIYQFMQEFVFNAESLNRSDIKDLTNYLNTLKLVGTKESKQAAETASTVFSQLDNYIGRQESRLDSFNSQGFKNYLFGERGVLTQKRLSDMRRAEATITKRKDTLQERTNYKIDRAKDGFDIISTSFTKDSQGNAIVNINDKKSLGMSTDDGRLYWGALDQMFDDSVDGNVNTRQAVTRYVKRSIYNSYEEGKVKMHRRNNWVTKKKDYYAKFLK